jgi:predicted HAD superfamily Cof-like phosphohydrolase
MTDSDVPLNSPTSQELLSALTDLVAKSANYGETADGFVHAYIVPTGPMHRAIAVLGSQGVHARPGFDPRGTAADVAEFHAAFGLPMRFEPSIDVPAELVELRIGLLEEEEQEFVSAARAADLCEIADALADVVYVAYGTALTYGIDLDAVLAEVHRSNMSKLDASGRPVLREDGKVAKSDRYSPPDIDGVLRRQVEESPA